MNKCLNILIIGIIIVKIILSIFFTISFLMVASELWAVRNQIEGKELVKETPEELFFLLVVFLANITTLLFDIKLLKIKDKVLYKKWINLTLLTLSIVYIGIYFKIQWLGISLMLLLILYSLVLLFKFSKGVK
jgi:hypothetical protein